MAPGSRLQELTAKYMQNPRRYFVPLANEYRKANELDRAIALCREHLPSQPGHMSGHIVLGRAYFEKGDVDAAREVFLTSVELDDENLIALRHLGDIAKAHHQLNEARQWYARVLDADPQNEEIERLLQSLLTAEGDAHGGLAQPAVPVESQDPQRGDAVAEPEQIPPTEFATALVDPTPPGLRAITFHADEFAAGSDDSAGSEAITHQLPPDPRVPLDRFDLSTLEPVASTHPATGTEAGMETGTEIRVDDGVGFIFDDLDQLVDPAAGSVTGSLPPVDEADFSAGVVTPTSPARVPSEPVADEILSRPGFGALASLASWRTAQGRETPTHPTAQPTPSASAPVQRPDATDSDDSLYWQPASADTASTAPEFITETMAALYEQQGFIQQALEVYQALLVRAPVDVALRGKVAEMRALLAAAPETAALKADADRALDFDAAEFSGAEEPFSAVAADEALSAASTRAWDGSEDSHGDWFADVPDAAVTPEGTAADGIYGVSSGVFGIPTRAVAGDGPLRSAERSVATLASVFGSPSVLATDESASELLLALASEMVGRLPKEAPTLPVPDVLDLPSSGSGDAEAGTSRPPLLSFDRFFSGSGAPPRARPDTPVSSVGVPDPWQSPVAVPPPSLSPTFGGLPVIPPASVTPAIWAAFEQFLPSPERNAALPTVGGLGSTPAIPTPPFASPPESALPEPAMRVPTTAPPVDAPPPTQTTPVSQQIVLPPAPTNPPEPIVPPAAEPPTVIPSAGEPPRAAPSEFHRWLEGLS